MTERTSKEARFRSLFTHAPHIRTINVAIIVTASVLSFMLLKTTDAATRTNQELQEATAQYVECSIAARNLEEASNYLTNNARTFAITHDIQNVHDYYEEIEVSRRRDEAVSVLERYVDSAEANRYLTTALDESNELAQQEGLAMHLVAEACAYPLEGDLTPLAEYALTADQSKLSPDEKLSLAQDLLFGEEYRTKKSNIDANVDLCTSLLIENTHDEQEKVAALLQSLLIRQRVLTVLLLVMVMLAIFLVVFLILLPLASYSKLISNGQRLVESGSQELRLLAREYNLLYEENSRRNDHLRHKADHDPLTGLLNRGAYDELVATHCDGIALMLVDVDYFKGVNDTYGHEVGDKILKKVARALNHTFRASDFPCRIGGDEFAIIITDMTPQHKQVVMGKINQIAQSMCDTSDGLPSTTLSIGVAFSEEIEEGDTVFKAADRALYLAKARGRNGYAFSDEAPHANKDDSPSEDTTA